MQPDFALIDLPRTLFRIWGIGRLCDPKYLDQIRDVPPVLFLLRLKCAVWLRKESVNIEADESLDQHLG